MKIPDLSSIPEASPWIALAVLAALLLWETAAPFFAFPKGRERVRHGSRNIFLGVLNAAMTSLAFVGLWWWAAAFSAERGIGLLHWLALPTWVGWIIAILLFDAWTYC